jgi:hypothetical protein
MPRSDAGLPTTEPAKEQRARNTYILQGLGKN